jgi:glycosyltransferase involved in cell wall biosynthesis
VRPDQIILVDSGSTDGTLEIASRFSVEVHRIEPEAFSFGRSLNLGCRASTGELLVFASAHVYPVYDTWLEQLTAPFADPSVALAYGRQVGGDESAYSERRVFARWFPPASATRQDHPFCNNANASIRRSVWESQPYDETLTGLEDVEWAKRAMEAGFAISYVADASVVHLHDQTWSELVSRYRREAIAHRQIYADQRMSAFEASRLAFANMASDYVHAARDRALSRNFLSIPMFRAAQFWGTYRGFRQRGEASAVLRRHFYYPHGWRRQADNVARSGRQIDYDESGPRDADVRSD